MSETVQSVLLFFAAFVAFIGACVRFGAIPTIGFRLLRRSENPEAFGAAIAVLCVVFCGLMAIVLFSGWVEENKRRLSLEDAAPSEARWLRCAVHDAGAASYPPILLVNASSLMTLRATSRLQPRWSTR